MDRMAEQLEAAAMKVAREQRWAIEQDAGAFLLCWRGDSVVEVFALPPMHMFLIHPHISTSFCRVLGAAAGEQRWDGMAMVAAAIGDAGPLTAIGIVRLGDPPDFRLATYANIGAKSSTPPTAESIDIGRMLELWAHDVVVESRQVTEHPERAREIRSELRVDDLLWRFAMGPSVLSTPNSLEWARSLAANWGILSWWHDVELVARQSR